MTVVISMLLEAMPAARAAAARNLTCPPTLYVRTRSRRSPPRGKGGPVQDTVPTLYALWFTVYDLGFRVQSLGFRV